MAKMINCKDCGKQISSSAKTCPGCGAKNKKPIYKRPWFIFFAALFIIGSLGGDDDNTKPSVNTNSPSSNIEREESYTTESNTQSSVEDSVPTEYKSALKKAQTYSDMMHMSKAGLYDQLTSEYGEKFSKEAAQYAIDNVNANWKENALKKAETYQDMMSMSPSAIYDQLTSQYGEKFTKEEAQYAIDNLK